MIKTKISLTAVSALAFATVGLSPAQADTKAPIELTKCAKSYGSIAVVEGETQGWSKFGLGSPRELVATIARESGCFSVHNAASGVPATYLVNVIAGDKEEVDKSIGAATGLASSALVYSGAAGKMLGKVPVAGRLLGAFGGLGGKKKTVAAGIRIISPANGQTLVSSSGEVKKSTLSFAGGGTPWDAGANSAGYASSNNGKMLTEAFIIAFNSAVAQASALTAVSAPAASATPAAAAPQTYVVAVDSKMYASADAKSAVVRSVRAETKLIPTGNKSGLFVEVSDSYGTKGWVSVESLR